jgi:hypothetical protein
VAAAGASLHIHIYYSENLVQNPLDYAFTQTVVAGGRLSAFDIRPWIRKRPASVRGWELWRISCLPIELAKS